VPALSPEECHHLLQSSDCHYLAPVTDGSINLGKRVDMSTWFLSSVCNISVVTAFRTSLSINGIRLTLSYYHPKGMFERHVKQSNIPKANGAVHEICNFQAKLIAKQDMQFADHSMKIAAVYKNNRRTT
jgi:hypothetical protein